MLCPRNNPMQLDSCIYKQDRLKPKTRKTPRKSSQGMQQSMWLFCDDMLEESSCLIPSLLSGRRGLCQESSPQMGASLKARCGAQSLVAWRPHWVRLEETIQRAQPCSWKKIIIHPFNLGRNADSWFHFLICPHIWSVSKIQGLSSPLSELICTIISLPSSLPCKKALEARQAGQVLSEGHFPAPY